jgi:PAS domain S-box-containing protein
MTAIDTFSLLLGACAGIALAIGLSGHVRFRPKAPGPSDSDLARDADARSIVDAAPDAMISTTADGVIEWSNEASASIFGQSRDDLRGARLSAILPAFEDSHIQRWMAEHGISGRVVAHETLGQRVDGTRFPCAVSCSVTRAREGTRYTFVVRDNTDSKWAEQELLLRERALESAADGITIASMELPGEPIIYVNQAFCRMTGYSADEVIGRNCRFLQGDEEQDQPAVEAMRRAIELREPTRVVVRNRRKDGTLFWNELSLSPVVREDGRVTHFVGVQGDITERMAQEETLRLRTERLNTIFDLSPDGFVALDEAGVIRIVNPAFERMTGLLAQELLGQSGDVLEARLAAICRGSEPAGAGPGGVDTTPAGKDEAASDSGCEGRLLHLTTTPPRTLLRRLRHSRGTGHETVMYYRDMTREIEVDRMKSEFLSMAAHELRTPMASIFGFTELLLRRKFDDTRRHDMLTTIHRQASLLINLVNELLDLARIESRRGKDFRREVQPLVPIIESTLAGILVHNDDRKVQADLPSTQVQVSVDSEKLSLALTNVISNAYKYSKAGDICLTLAQREHEAGLQVGVRVTDHGIGMTPEQQSRLFERFFRADTSGNIPGTGLGMTIVKEIVELLDGQVEVSSEFGRGTVVTLWLPRVQSVQTPSGVEPACQID